MYPLPDIVGLPVGEPSVHTVLVAGNVFIKTFTLPATGTLIGQHSHKYSHASQVAAGSARYWKNGEWLCDVVAPHSVEIEAHAHHMVQTLEPNTVVNCIHCTATAEASIEEAEQSLIEVR